MFMYKYTKLIYKLQAFLVLCGLGYTSLPLVIDGDLGSNTVGGIYFTPPEIFLVWLYTGLMKLDDAFGRYSGLKLCIGVNWNPVTLIYMGNW